MRTSLKAVTVALVLSTSLGCAGSRAGVRLEAPPPAPPVPVVEPRPEWLWVGPHVETVAGQAVTREGHWVPARPGMIWVQGAWKDAGGYWAWEWGHFEKAPSDVEAR